MINKESYKKVASHDELTTNEIYEDTEAYAIPWYVH